MTVITPLKNHMIPCCNDSSPPAETGDSPPDILRRPGHCPAQAAIATPRQPRLSHVSRSPAGKTPNHLGRASIHIIQFLSTISIYKYAPAVKIQMRICKEKSGGSAFLRKILFLYLQKQQVGLYISAPFFVFHEIPQIVLGGAGAFHGEV